MPQKQACAYIPECFTRPSETSGIETLRPSGPQYYLYTFDSLCFPFPKAEIELFWFRLFLAHEGEGEGGLVQDLHGETSRNPFNMASLMF